MSRRKPVDFANPLNYEGEFDIVGEVGNQIFAYRDAQALADETDHLALGGDTDSYSITDKGD